MSSGISVFYVKACDRTDSVENITVDKFCHRLHDSDLIHVGLEVLWLV